MSLDIALNKGMSSILILAFFVLILLLLRFLYGPRGIFRDPEWDRWNESARLEREANEDSRQERSLREALTEYAERFFTGDPDTDGPLRLKLEHTFRVAAHARKLAAEEPELGERTVARALYLAALFHDVGRFEQFTRYRTFADSLSCNHGALGVKIIRNQRFMDGEDAEVKRLVLSAICLHNRLDIPARLAGRMRAVLSGLRDADKLDILHVLVEHLEPGRPADSVVLLHLRNEPTGYSPGILAALESGCVALYEDMRYVNDFRILLCSWLYDMHFMTSLHILKRERHLERIIAGLAPLPDVQTKVRAVTDGMLDRI